MPADQYRGKSTPWTCSSCLRDLRIPQWYLRFLSWSTLGISLALCYVVGLRGIQFVLAPLISAFPMYAVCKYLLHWIVPTPLEKFPRQEANKNDLSNPAQPSLPPLTPLYRCPSCRSSFRHNFPQRGRPVTCPTCARQLMAPIWFKNLVFWSGVGLAILISWFVELRGPWLFIGTILLAFPVLVVWSLSLGQIIPTPLKPFLPEETTLFPK
jgi:hypothetical protein